MTAVHKAGLSVIDSSRAVSALFYFGIAIVVWMYTRSWLSLIVLILPETMILGQANEPDGMSVFFLLFGFWLVFVKRRDLGLLVLLLSVWVRPENALLCLLTIVVLVFDGRLDGYSAAVLAALCVGSEVLINHYGYPWQELYNHMIGGEPGTGTALHLSDYLRTLMKGVHDVLHSTVPIFALLWLICFPKMTPDLRRIMGITLLFSVARFVVFPPYEPRYYGLFFVTTAIASVLAVKDGSYQRMITEQLRRIPRVSFFGRRSYPYPSTSA